jgi:hypothetical protein
MFDRETGGMLEYLHLRPELGAFDRAIRERIEHAAAFEDERFAHARSVERDPRTGAVVIVSEFVAGNRLSDLLDGVDDGSEGGAAPGIDAALGFLLEVLPALAALNTATGLTHGAVGPGRIVVTATGQVILLDWMYAQALERLRLNRDRLWRELGLATPVSAGAGRFDGGADVGQAALTAVMIVMGRLLRVDEYPYGLTALVSEVVDIAQIRGSARFATGLQRFLHRALPLPGSRPFLSADEAGAVLRQLAREIGVTSCRTALASFVSEFNRVRELEESAADGKRPAGDTPDAARDAWPSEGPPGDSTDAAKNVSASMEVEITLDDVLSESATGQDALDAEPIPYEISLGAQDGDALLVVHSAHAGPVEDQPDPAAIDPILEALRFIPPPAQQEPLPELDPTAAADVIDASAPAVITADPVWAEAAAPSIEASIDARAALPVDIPTAESAAALADTITALLGGSSTPAEPELRTASVPPEIDDTPAPAVSAIVPEPTAPQAGHLSQVPPAPAQNLPLEAPPAPPQFVAPLPANLAPEPPHLAQAAPAPPGEALYVIPAPVQTEPVPMPPEPEPVHTAPATAPATSVPPPRQRRRGAKGDRDKLRSIAKPAPAAAPPRPAPAPAAMPYYPPVFDPRQPPTAPAATWTPVAPRAVVAPPVILPKPPPPAAAVRVKTEAPAGYAPPQRRGGHHESSEINPTPYVERGTPAKPSSLYWKIGAAAALVLAVGAGAIVRPYLTGPAPAEVVPASTPAAAPALKAGPAAAAGSLNLVTQPPGTRVLLDGAPAGETPLTIESVSPGRHTITFVTSSGSVRKTVRVEAGKTASLDVPVFSGWIAVFAPVLLEIAENGRSIGTSEQGRLMLAPGRHQLTFTNRDLGYISSQTVDVEPGEERSVNILPTGELSLNALPWAEVWIDGQKTGDTPIANLPVPLGTHEIVFKNPQYPDRRVTTTVRANAPSAAAVDFTKSPSP